MSANPNATRPSAQSFRTRALPGILLFVFLGAWFATPALADDDETREVFSEQARTIRSLWVGFQDQIAGIRFRLDEDAYLGARFEDTDLHWFRTALTIDGALPIPDRRRGLAMSFSTAIIVPVANGSTRIVDLRGSRNDPFDEFLDSAFRVGGHAELGYGFKTTFAMGLSARHEIGADLKSALAVGGSLSLEYRRGKWLQLRLGVGLGTGIDRARVSVSPVFRLRIRPLPRVWLETDGTSGRIEWEQSSRFTLSLFGGVDSKRFRLADRHGAIGAGSIEIRKSEVGIGIQTRVGAKIRIKIELAVVLGQRLSFEDENQQRIDALDTREPSGALRIAFEWRPPIPSRAVPTTD